MIQFILFLNCIFALTIDDAKSLSIYDENLNFARECETNCGAEMFDCITACGESAEDIMYYGNILFFKRVQLWIDEKSSFKIKTAKFSPLE